MQNTEHWSHSSYHMLPWLKRREKLQVLDLSGAAASLQTHCLPLLCHIYNKRLDFLSPHGWLTTSCCGTFTSTQKYAHIDQRLSRSACKRQETTNERVSGPSRRGRLGLIPPGGPKVLDGHSWQAPPTHPGSIATRLGTRWSICVPFKNANKEFYNVTGSSHF